MKVYSNNLDTSGTDGRARMLQAYSRMVAKQETLMIARELHTKTYAKVLNRGRTQFLTYLESTGHPCMQHYSIDSVNELYKDKTKNLAEISSGASASQLHLELLDLLCSQRPRKSAEVRRVQAMKAAMVMNSPPPRRTP